MKRKIQLLFAVWLMLLGYVKKVVIADQLAQVVQWGFSRPYPPFSDANAWLIIYAFAFQIYGDFSGYSHTKEAGCSAWKYAIRLRL